MMLLASTMLAGRDEGVDAGRAGPVRSVIAASSALTAARSRASSSVARNRWVYSSQNRASCRTRRAVEAPGVEADLLLELAGGGGLGRLAVDVALARRNLEQLAAGGDAVLPHEHASPSITGTTTTAPGWCTTCRSNSSPSGPATRARDSERKPASQSVLDADDAELGSRGRSRRTAASAVAGEGQLRAAAVGPVTRRRARTRRTAGAAGRAGS